MGTVPLIFFDQLTTGNPAYVAAYTFVVRSDGLQKTLVYVMRIAVLITLERLMLLERSVAVNCEPL
jgi:hypothetical protein